MSANTVSNPVISSLLLIGGGGHCRAVADVLEALHVPIAGIVDKNTDIVMPYPVLGDDEDLPQLREHYSFALVTIGQITNTAIRKNIFAMLEKLNFSIPCIISQTAYISPTAICGNGTVVLHNSMINAYSKIGNNCIINTKSLIEHDCIIGDHCHISTGTIVNGGVIIGNNCFIGSGSIIKQGITIHDNCFINMGMKIAHDVPPNTRLLK